MSAEIANRSAQIEAHSDEAETRRRFGEAINVWMRGKSKNTKRAQLGDLRHFATFVRGEATYDPIDGIIVLTEKDQLEAESAIADWQADMMARGLQPTSIARRLASLRSLAKVLKRFGLPWDLADIKGPSYSPYARATGPEVDTVEAKLDELEAAADGDDEAHSTLVAARDYAIMTLLYHTAMRRETLVSLTWSDAHLSGRKPHMFGVVKGGSTRRFPVSQRVVTALRRWRALRVAHLGRYSRSARVFVGVVGPARGESMSGDAVYKRTKYRHNLSGPHGLRHTAGTAVFERSGDLRLATDLLGHANAATTQAYMDRQGGAAEEATRLLSGEAIDQ